MISLDTLRVDPVDQEANFLTIIPTEKRPDTVPALVEIFALSPSRTYLCWLAENENRPPTIKIRGNSSPHLLALEWLAALGEPPLAFRNTSWRFERGQLILTFAALFEQLPPLDTLAPVPVPLPDRELQIHHGPTSAWVLQHSVRCLSRWVAEDSEFRDSIGETLARLLSTHPHATVSCADDLLETSLKPPARAVVPAAQRSNRTPHLAPFDLAIDRDATSFVLRGEAPVSLRSRKALRGILKSLLDARLESPGEGVRPVELITAGWPNQRIELRAARNRLQNAIASLRSLGLREILVTSGRGYLLLPCATVRILQDS